MSVNENKKEKLIEMKNLKKYFPMKKRQVLKAVENVTMDIYKGEILSLVGESGSGKTTLGRTVSRLYSKTNGDILFNGKPVENYGRKEFTKKVQMIFQDPQASLNPRMTVGDIIAEGIDIHKLATSKQERMERVYKLLEIVGLNREHASRFPHEFSGGQRQRIGIARALAVDPEVLVCDEPISALDVSIQAQVVNLLKDLQKERNLTLLFIAHDLSMVKYISDRVAVMYRGKVVELGTPEVVYTNPIHSYTKSLISAVPIADPDYKKLAKIDMDESYLRSPMGEASEINVIPEKPELTEFKPGHFVETSFLEEKGLKVPKTWAEIVDSKYKDEIIMANPAVSGTSFANVKGLIDMYGEEKAWEYFKKLNDNVKFYGKRGKDPQEKTVAGEFGIGIIPIDKSAFDVAEKNNLTAIYPEDGLCWVPEGVAIFKNSPNLEVAKAFEDFILRPENQQLIAELDGKDGAQMVIEGTKGYDLGLPKDKFIKEDIKSFGSQRDDILKKWAELTQGK